MGLATAAATSLTSIKYNNDNNMFEFGGLVLEMFNNSPKDVESKKRKKNHIKIMKGNHNRKGC